MNGFLQLHSFSHLVGLGALEHFPGRSFKDLSVHACQCNFIFLFAPGEAGQGKQTSKNGKIVSQNGVPQKEKLLKIERDYSNHFLTTCNFNPVPGNILQKFSCT